VRIGGDQGAGEARAHEELVDIRRCFCSRPPGKCRAHGLVSTLGCGPLSYRGGWVRPDQEGELISNGGRLALERRRGLFLSVVIGAALGMSWRGGNRWNVLLSPLVEMFYRCRNRRYPATVLWLGFGKTAQILLISSVACCGHPSGPSTRGRAAGAGLVGPLHGREPMACCGTWWCRSAMPSAHIFSHPRLSFILLGARNYRWRSRGWAISSISSAANGSYDAMFASCSRWRFSARGRPDLFLVMHRCAVAELDRPVPERSPRRARHAHHRLGFARDPIVVLAVAGNGCARSAGDAVHAAGRLSLVLERIWTTSTGAS